MLRRIVAFTAVAAIAAALFMTFGAVGRASAKTAARSMIVIERDSGRVLDEFNADVKLPMASTTKIVTAITVIERVDDIKKIVKVPDAAVGVEGSSIYLERGETMSVEDLLYGLMLQSGNDCATALAITTAGSVEKFAALMNETALKAGAQSSNFVNPHGLHHDEHYTTARDLAKISAYAMKNETFRKIVGTKSHRAPWQDRDYDRVIINKNKILNTFEGGDGIKTGYTKKAGRCLVASSTRNGMSVIAVVLNCSPMFEECRALMEKAHSTYQMYDVSEHIEEIYADVENGKCDKVRLGIAYDALYPLRADEIGELKYELCGVKTMSAPVKKGQENGKIKIYASNRLLFETKLFSIEEVAPLSVTDRLGEIIDKWQG